MSTVALADFRIARLTGDDVRHSTEPWRAFEGLVLSNESMYPGINHWLRKKVATSLVTPGRSAYVAYIGNKPVASAVLKRGARAKFCHLRVDDAFQDLGLGEAFFCLMALDARQQAREIHFTLPEGLWQKRRGFFESFGFNEARGASSQYRLFESELRCSAPFERVWAAVQQKLPALLAHCSLDGHEADGALLMSIHPRYAELILEGRKSVEIRRRFPARWAGHRICLYATQPTGSLVGEARIAQVLPGSPESIWAALGSRIGCTKEEFDAYVGSSQEVSAIVLKDTRPYCPPIPREEVSRLAGRSLRPPQSYELLETDGPWARAISIANALQPDLPAQLRLAV